MDLALIQFPSDADYSVSVAVLSNYTYRLQEIRDPSSEESAVELYRIPQGKDQHFVFVSGWPLVENSQLVTNPGIWVDVSGSSVSRPGAGFTV